MFFIKKRLLFVILLILSALILAAVFYRPQTTQDSEYAMAAVDENLKKEISNKIRELIGIRNRAILEEAPEVINSMYDVSRQAGSAAYNHEMKKLKYIHKWEEKQGVTFQAINSDIVIKSIRQKDGGIYQLGLLLNTEYVYSYNDEPGMPNSFREGTYHTLDMISKGNTWLIAKDWYAGTFESTLNLGSISESTIQTIAQGADRDFSSLDDKRQAALTYINLYCGAAGLPDYGYEYNNCYYNYNNLGGDCANFASQMLYEAGGFKMTSSWKYTGNSGTAAWVNAQKFKNHILSSERGTLIASGTYQDVLEQSYQLQPGDIIAYGTRAKVTHISIVSGADSKGYTLVNCHNADRCRVPWDLGWSDANSRFWLITIHY